jgi:hypothetical protein
MGASGDAGLQMADCGLARLSNGSATFAGQLAVARSGPLARDQVVAGRPHRNTSTLIA